MAIALRGEPGFGALGCFCFCVCFAAFVSLWCCVSLLFASRTDMDFVLQVLKMESWSGVE